MSRRPALLIARYRWAALRAAATGKPFPFEDDWSALDKRVWFAQLDDAAAATPPDYPWSSEAVRARAWRSYRRVSA